MSALGRVALLGAFAACAGRPPIVAPPVVIAGTFEPGRSPDGNSVVLDAPDGLIVVDTGRHPAHQQALLARARAAGRPIAAIVNTHWHLDHTGGNAELLAAYPHAAVVATTAIEGALVGFFPGSRADAEAFLASGQATADQVAEIQGDFAAVDAPAALRPTVPVTRSGPMTIAGRPLEVHVAPFAATEADLWIEDRASRTVIAGDLVVAEVPFLDTACAAGWRTALGAIAAVRFDQLIPGHGAPMTPAAFATWRAAFDALVTCGTSDAPVDNCVAGWMRDADAFIPAADRPRVLGMLRYYIPERLRSTAARDRFCAPLR